MGNAKCIFITGMGHSGTRLMIQMFAQHPQVSVPLSILNRVEEYTPLHQYFIKSMDITSVDSDRYAIDTKELHTIMNRYMSKVDAGKPYFVFKMPYYPLNCMDFYADYFKQNLVLLNIRRPKHKVLNSFLRKGEDKTLFTQDPKEFIRQIKKLKAQDRKKYFENKDFKLFFEELYAYVDEKVQDWDSAHPENKFVDVDIEQFATSPEYVAGVLAKIGLASDCVREMFRVVNQDRLLVKFTGKLRNYVPPSVLRWGSKLLARSRE